MSAILCRYCGVPVPSDDVSHADGVARCPSCGGATPLTDEMMREAETDATVEAAEVDPGQPPSRCSFEPLADGFEIRLDARSIPGGLFMIVFAAIWNSFVWFMFGALHFGAMGGSPGGGPPIVFKVVFTLFLVPFMLVGLVTISMALLLLFGTYRIRVEGDRGEIFTGVGSLGYRRRFNPRHISAVNIVESRCNTGHMIRQVAIEGDSTLKLGQFLNTTRRAWVVAVLRRELLGRR